MTCFDELGRGPVGHGELKRIADQAEGDAYQLASIVEVWVRSRLVGNAVTQRSRGMVAAEG